MPVPEGTRFRFKTLPNGKRIRLAFSPSGKVIEVKSYKEIFDKKRKNKWQP